jgi:hypothetical protein
MTIDDIESLVRRLLAAGMAAAVVLAAPAAGAGTTSDPPTMTVEPSAPRSDQHPEKKSDEDDHPDTAGAATSAAAKYGWGTPTHVDDFSHGLGRDWDVYDGPGHEGQGRRAPSAVSVANGVLTITGDGRGTTAGMSWDTGQKYGRWEGRVRAPAAADSYHALMLLWPDAENWPVGGEVDFMEMTDGERQSTNMFLHYGKDNSQVSDDVAADATKWHNWAVEWTPKGITAYLDGKQWFRSTDPMTLPPGPMHLCIQLDWFPGDGATRTSTMQVDWVKQYALDTGHQPSGNRKDQQSGYKTAALTTATAPGWHWIRHPAATSGSAGAPSGR